MPAFDFTVSESLAPWNMSEKEWLAKNDKHWDGLVVGNIVFNPEDRILLIQRSSRDTMTNKWEIPGGAVDNDDLSLPYAAARELWEESGLIAKHFTYMVTEAAGRDPGFVFPNRHGTRLFCRFSFNVVVEDYDNVKLNPEEHQDFVWATEEEVREQKVGSRKIEITNVDMQALLLEGFRLQKLRSQVSG